MGQIAQNYNVNELYVNESRRLLTEALEVAIAGLWSSLTTNISLTSTTVALSDAEIRLGLYTMENLKYHLDECALKKRRTINLAICWNIPLSLSYSPMWQ